MFPLAPLSLILSFFFLFLASPVDSIIESSTDSSANPIAKRDDGLTDTIIMPTPTGYVDVSPEVFPAYFSAIEKEFEFIDVELLRLFIPANEIPFLEKGDFDLVTKNILVTRWKGEDHPSFEEAIVNVTKTPLVDRKQELNSPRITSWLEAHQQGENTNGAITIGTTHRAENYITLVILGEKKEGHSWGFISDKVVAQVLVSTPVDGHTVGMYFNRLVSTPKDVANTIDEASTYTQSSDFSLTMAQIPFIPRSCSGYSLHSYAANLWRDQGRAEKALPVYTALLSFWASIGDEAKGLWLSANFDVVHLYINTMDYEKAEKLAATALAESEPILGKEDEMVLKTQALRSSILVALKRYEEARDLLNAVMAINTQTPTLSDAAMVDVYMNLGIALVELKEPVKDVLFTALLGVTELWTPAETAAPLGLVRDMYRQQQQPALAIFFNKLRFSHTLFALEKGSRENGMPQAEQHNGTEPSLYTAGRSLMQGPEIELYAHYKKVAEALDRYGKEGRSSEGTSEELKKARKDFRAWLETVETTLKTPEQQPSITP